MQNYYQILGVSTHASQEEIRSAYRKLVVKYHPDRNPDPEAAERIREINLAYDVLGDADKRRKYDLARTMSRSQEPASPPAPAHRDPAYRRRAYAPPQNRQPVVSEWMRRYRKYSYKLSGVAFVFCLILVIDAVIPSRTVQEKVIRQTIDSRHRLPGGDSHYFITIWTNYGSRVRFGSSFPKSFDQDRIVSISRTRLLAIPRRVVSSEQIVERVPATLLGNFIFLPLVLLITSGIGVYFKGNVQLQTSLGVVNAFVLFLCLLFYLLFN